MSLYIPRFDFQKKNFTGTTSIGSPTITAIPDTSELVAGQVVKGDGIPFRTTILSKTISTVTLSANATAANTGEDFTAATMIEFVYPPEEDTEWQQKAVGTNTKSISGVSQIVTQYIEETRKITFGFITSTLANSIRSIFIADSLLGGEFDYFEDKAVDSYYTSELSALTHARKRQVKKHPSFLYQFDVSIRKIQG